MIFHVMHRSRGNVGGRRNAPQLSDSHGRDCSILFSIALVCVIDIVRVQEKVITILTSTTTTTITTTTTTTT